MEKTATPAMTGQFLDSVFRYVEECGGSVERVRARAKLNLVPDPRANYIDVNAIAHLLRCVSAETEDRQIGLSLGAYLDLRVMGTISYVVANAPSVGIALRNLVRYQSSFTRGFACFYEADDHISVGFRMAQNPTSSFRDIEEFCVGLVVHTMRTLIGSVWRTTAVRFEHDSPRAHSVYQKHLGCVPEFGYDRTELIISKQVAEEVIPFADRQLLPLIEDRLQAFDDGEDAFISALRSEIAHTLCDGTPTIKKMAPRFQMSSRTMQRRLTNKGTTFRVILTELRKSLAQEYLSRRDADLLEIALLLGYADLSSFCHAYFSWFQQWPSAFRRIRNEK